MLRIATLLQQPLSLIDRLIQHHLHLTGSVFQNQILTRCVSHALDQQGFHVLIHRHVPANDGSLSLVQGAIAAARYLISR